MPQRWFRSHQVCAADGRLRPIDVAREQVPDVHVHGWRVEIIPGYDHDPSSTVLREETHRLFLSNMAVVAHIPKTLRRNIPPEMISK
eukprot:8849319-Heterocapsa_arctica.AAC.1